MTALNSNLTFIWNEMIINHQTTSSENYMWSCSSVEPRLLPPFTEPNVYCPQGTRDVRTSWRRSWRRRRRWSSWSLKRAAFRVWADASGSPETTQRWPLMRPRVSASFSLRALCLNGRQVLETSRARTSCLGEIHFRLFYRSVGVFHPRQEVWRQAGGTEHSVWKLYDRLSLCSFGAFFSVSNSGNRRALESAHESSKISGIVQPELSVLNSEGPEVNFIPGRISSTRLFHSAALNMME